MLELLHLKNVGPAPAMKLDLAPRLNLITGDNGLGKSFLLDVAWWALTRTWAREKVLPAPPPAKATIAFEYTKVSPGTYAYSSEFRRENETWSVKAARPAVPGLVLYAQVDGGFSVWDPARNYFKKEDPDRPASYLFQPQEVWNGNEHCEGLVRDWASWQREGGDQFDELKRVLDALSPSEGEPLVPGKLRKLTLDDPRRHPTLRMPYGQEVPVIHASAGMRRIIALGYLLVWAWHEHVAASKLLGRAPAKEVIFLVDEVEAHLHPRWQLRIVPALLAVMDALAGKHRSRVQLITATHSPLVLSSVEPIFDAKCDAWLDLDLDLRTNKVVLRQRDFLRLGTAGRWLTSKAFDLPNEGRSPAATAVLKKAAVALSDEAFSKKDARKLDADLREVLGDTDPFWSRWRFVGEARGWLTAPSPAGKPKGNGFRLGMKAR